MSKNHPLFYNKKSVKYHYRRDVGLTGHFLYILYRFHNKTLRKFVMSLFDKLIGKHYQFYSISIRRIFSDFHGINIGSYSHGSCFNYLNIPAGTTIGRYSSISRGVSIHAANHPHNTISSHGFFFNTTLGIVNKNIASYTRLNIGNDVYIGFNAIILPSCSSIGDGAVIGAGSVINKNIPPYAIVVGNPGRIVSYRFSEEKIKEISNSKWWEKEIFELLDNDITKFQNPINSKKVR